jgi:hypothetical protein
MGVSTFGESLSIQNKCKVFIFYTSTEHRVMINDHWSLGRGKTTQSLK